MRKKISVLGGSLLGAALVLTVAAVAARDSSANASHAPASAASYIDREAPTSPVHNPDVEPDSDCPTPDQRDAQERSDPASTNPAGNKNVHNDACLFDEFGVEFDGPVTFESKGVGTISACPDPDVTATSNGPRTSVRHDHDGDGSFEHCHQTGYQVKGNSEDFEYHARLNLTTNQRPGIQKVTFCSDPDQDGCDDEDGFLKDKIQVKWE